MPQYHHKDFDLYAGVFERGKHDRDRSFETMTFNNSGDDVSGYRAPLLPCHVIQDLLDAGFEYHLPANNVPGFWTHPLIAKVLFSTHQAMSRLGLLPSGTFTNVLPKDSNRQWSP